METIIKYYKYTDVETGELKKDVGLVTARLAVKSKKRVEQDNSLTTISEEKYHIINENKPKADGILEEITKEEFEAIPAESLVDDKRLNRFERVQQHRSRIFNRAEAVRARRSAVQNTVTNLDDASFEDLKEKQNKKESIIVPVVDKKDKKDK